MTLLILLSGLLIFICGSVYILVFYEPGDVDTKSAPKQNKKKSGRMTVARKAAASRSEKRRLPYRYADDHLFVYGNTVWTGVRLPSVTDEYLSLEELQDQVSTATLAVRDLASGDTAVEVHTRLTYRPVTAETWAEELIQRAWDPTENYDDYTRRVAAKLSAEGSARPEVVLFVKMSATRSDTAETVDGEDAASLATNASSRITGVADEQFSPYQVAEWTRIAESIHATLSPLGATPITREDLLWYIRKPLFGHLTPAPIDTFASRPWGAGEFQLAVDFRARHHKTHIDIVQAAEDAADAPSDGADVMSHSTFLVAADWPDEMRFRQSKAWMRYLARLGYPIEVSYRKTIRPWKKFRDEMRRIRGDLRDEIGDMEKSKREPDHKLMDYYEDADQVFKSIENESLPGMDAEIVLGLSASSLEELERIRAEVIRRVKNDLGIVLVRPKRYQWTLLRDMLPGQAPQSLVKPYVQLQETDVFGVGLPRAGSEVGDQPQVDKRGRQLGWRGDYIGMVDDVPAHYSMHVGPARHKGGGVGVIGASGGGKSTFGLLKFWQESESGGRSVAIDPKTDFAAMCYYLAFGSQVTDPEFHQWADEGRLDSPECPFKPVNQAFWDETDIIDITRSQDGILDAWQIARTVGDGQLLAETMFRMFLGQSDYERCRIPIIDGIESVMEDYNERVAQLTEQGMTTADAEQRVAPPTMKGVADRVEASYRDVVDTEGNDPQLVQELRLASRLIGRLRKLPMSRLAFADNPRPMGQRLRKRRTVITLRGVERPKGSDPNVWTPPQQLAATILYAVTHLTSDALQVGNEKNPVTGEYGLRPKAVFIDEAYVLSAIVEGRELIKTLLAQGRSYNVVTMLIDQQAGRLAQIEEENKEDGEATGNQFHSVFGFLQKTPPEAARVAPLLGRPGHQETIQALQSVNNRGKMETGVCIFRDADDRAATLRIDPVFEELLNATDTNPDTRVRSQSVDLEPDVARWQYLDSRRVRESVERAKELVESGDPVEPEPAEQPEADHSVGEMATVAAAAEDDV